ncbi:MAG: DUF4423 domain-containing protein [Oligoflexales bacterium]
MYAKDPDSLINLPALEWIREEYHARRHKNPSYSLRAFAKFLELSPGRLSNFLASKRPLTRKTGERIADKLGYNPTQRQIFLDKIRKARTEFDKTPQEVEWKAEEVKADVFELIANWHYFAIRNLIKTEGFSSDPKGIAKRLGISVIEVRTAIDRLKRLGLVDEQDGELALAQDNLKTSTSDVMATALRQLHRQHMEKAIESMETVEREKRDITGITMAIDLSKLAEAKRKIQTFRRSMSDFLEDGTQTEVYHLGIQLFPLSI